MAREKLTSCLNCELKFATINNFCPECGQKNQDLLIPIRTLFQDAFDSFFNWDSKMWYTIKTSFSKAGKLVNEFNAGKRVRYVSPIRFYFAASIIFFLAVSLSTNKGSQETSEDIKETLTGLQDTIQMNLVNVQMDLPGVEIEKAKDYNDSQVDSLLRSYSIEPNFFYRLSFKQSMRIMNGGIGSLLDTSLQILSFGMFVLMPLFALLLKLFYRKSKKFYVEYLVSSLHIHTLGFLIFSVQNLLGMLFPTISMIIQPIFLIGFLIYGFLNLKYIYRESWRRTTWKFLLITLIYSIILMIAVVLIMLIGLMIF